MNNLDALKPLVAALVRWALNLLFGWLIARGYLSQDSLLIAVGVIAGAITTALWALWTKYKDKILIRMALQMPAGATHADLKAAYVQRCELPPERRDKI